MFFPVVCLFCWAHPLVLMPDSSTLVLSDHKTLFTVVVGDWMYFFTNLFWLPLTCIISSFKLENVRKLCRNRLIYLGLIIHFSSWKVYTHFYLALVCTWLVDPELCHIASYKMVFALKRPVNCKFLTLTLYYVFFSPPFLLLLCLTL